VARINTGMFQVEGRFIKAGFRGCSDILGMLKGGRLLAVECKSGKGKETTDQAAFGARVAADGGLYIVARSVDDVMEGLTSA
jgi:ABC-type phosphonate transport system ATPase subunit